MDTLISGLSEFFTCASAGTTGNPFKFLIIREEPEPVPLHPSVPQFTTGGGLCICLQGKGNILLNGKNYLIQKGDLCVVFPNTLFQAIGKSPDFKGYILGVTDQFIQTIRIPSFAAVYLYIKDNPCISLSEEEQNKLVAMCERIKECDTQKNHPYRREIIEKLLVILCYEVAAIYHGGQPIADKPGSRKDILFWQFILLVYKHCKTRREVRFYAEKMCITPRYLSAAVKEASGKTAGNWIAETVILNIKNQLISTQQSIQQISDLYAFPNPSFFCQFFKKHTGKTPKEYRTENGS